MDLWTALHSVHEVYCKQPASASFFSVDGCTVDQAGHTCVRRAIPVIGRMLLQLQRVQRRGKRLLRLSNGVEGGAVDNVHTAQREARILTVQVSASTEDQIALRRRVAQ